MEDGMDGDLRAVIEEWHRVVNEGDVTVARTIVTDDVEVGGPRGSASGVDAFISWIESAGIHLEPVAWHPLPDAGVVVEQRASRPGGGRSAEQHPIPVVTLFKLRGDRIAGSWRFDTVREALVYPAAVQ
ncbi:MAG: nuclear transport factor 2 family protein [Sphingomonas sp.]|uniref:Nuclear transport factor 2 family protein n=1 Tax=Sphingomonas adhaesiva TaxID=28212 RepID=A0A2A4I957_9SPHN|nr:nuclear transport factor 2 family protein [Sphingomonas adhaesiva]PCG14322.1 nuclear transport factor 2 family protein [Sphingomonas adhaesiva]PZU75683.1 MAG: nuclear transport factor 2 family protein [Sphingomonas sp.]